jgi:hypothetical protein
MVLPSLLLVLDKTLSSSSPPPSHTLSPAFPEAKNQKHLSKLPPAPAPAPAYTSASAVLAKNTYPNQRIRHVHAQEQT